MEEQELAELRKKRAEELRRAQEMEGQKRMLLKNLVDSAAYERLMNVRLANPELYDQLVAVMAQLYRAGQIRGKIGEAQVVQLLHRLRGSDREPTITIKRKD
jgi:programmed cell death protein 5